MADQIPPPGPERDAEIAKAIGWELACQNAATGFVERFIGERGRGWRLDAATGRPLILDGERLAGIDQDIPTTKWTFVWLCPDGSLRQLPPRYSTDPAACDRLVEELTRRGFAVATNASANTDGSVLHSADVYAGAGIGGAVAVVGEVGESRPDAVSAAALRALRGPT